MKILPTKFARYSVSDTGIVYRDGKEIKSHARGVSTKNGTGRYQAVNISIYDDNGKFVKQIKYYVHRLVAEVFIENPNNLNEVDHIDCNKENNHVENLRWCTRGQNMAWVIGRTYTLPEEGSIREYKNGKYTKTFIRRNERWEYIPKRK